MKKSFYCKRAFFSMGLSSRRDNCHPAVWRDPEKISCQPAELPSLVLFFQTPPFGGVTVTVITFLLFFIFTAPTFSAPALFYSFDSPLQEQLFTRLTKESRCLVCQNQSLADSDAPLAVDLRNDIYRLVKQGNDEKMIQNFLVQRYGHYILLRPPLNKNTWILWVSPFLLLVLGFVVLFYYLPKN